MNTDELLVELRGCRSGDAYLHGGAILMLAIAGYLPVSVVWREECNTNSRFNK
jgi:hypothetical protein